jgi:hypothetical protein
MPSKNWTKAVIGLFSAIIFAASVFTGESIDKHGLQWISGASSAVILLLVLYDRWVWRWPLVRRLSALAGHPVIHGTWKSELAFERDVNGQPGTLTCYFSVYQTFSSVQVRGFFTTSESRSLTARIDRPQPNQIQLVFAYRSEAPHSKRNDNRPHDGTTMLNIISRPVEALSGSYYTDRGGAGTIKAVEYSKKLSESYDQAARRQYKKLS